MDFDEAVDIIDRFVAYELDQYLSTLSPGHVHSGIDGSLEDVQTALMVWRESRDE